MKKIMIAAAAVAMVGGAFAIPAPGQCNGSTTGCEPAVFKLTGSGKISVDKGDYKTVDSLKVTKGLIVANQSTTPANVEKSGFKATVAIGNCGYQIDATDWTKLTNGVVFSTSGTQYSGSFVAEKLAQKATSRDDVNALFKGKTTTVTVTLRERDGMSWNTVKTGTVKATFVEGSIEDLADVRFETMTWLVAEGDDICNDCFDAADVFVLAKVGKETIALKYEGMEFAKWAVFGKKYADYEAVAGSNYKYSYSLDSEIGLYAADLAGNIIEANLYMTGFGTAKLSQGSGTSKAAICGEGECIITTKAAITYSGWFVGGYDDGSVPEEACWLCNVCGGYLYGGTWKATYDEKLSEQFAVADYDALAEKYLGRELDDILQ